MHLEIILTSDLHFILSLLARIIDRKTSIRKKIATKCLPRNNKMWSWLDSETKCTRFECMAFDQMQVFFFHSFARSLAVRIGLGQVIAISFWTFASTRDKQNPKQQIVICILSARTCIALVLLLWFLIDAWPGSRQVNSNPAFQFIIFSVDTDDVLNAMKSHKFVDAFQSDTTERVETKQKWAQ